MHKISKGWKLGRFSFPPKPCVILYISPLCRAVYKWGCSVACRVLSQALLCLILLTTLSGRHRRIVSIIHSRERWAPLAGGFAKGSPAPKQQIPDWAPSSAFPGWHVRAPVDGICAGTKLFLGCVTYFELNLLRDKIQQYSSCMIMCSRWGRTELGRRFSWTSWWDCNLAG